MVCQCDGTGKGIKSKVGGELELSLQALFTYLCDLCAFKCAISPLIFNISPLIFNKHMVVDVLTKALSKERHHNLINMFELETS
jgi:hypothetical protein